MFEVTNTLFQVQSVVNTRKDADSLETDLSVERAKTTFFLFLPGNTPGIFVFLVFGTTAGCRKAMYDIFVPKRCRGSGGSWGSCIPWARKKRQQPGAREATSTDPESMLFDRPDDTTSYTARTARSELTKSPDLNKPLPVVAMSRYNKTYQAECYSPSPRSSPSPRQSPSPHWQQHGLGDQVRGVEGEGQGGIPLHPMRSLDSVRDDYYQPQPEQSDDSGPMLPIMRDQFRNDARGSPRRPPRPLQVRPLQIQRDGRGVRRPNMSIDYGYH